MEATAVSTERWMDKDDVYIPIYNEILLTKNNEIMPFSATWMGLEIFIPSETSQTEKDKIIWDHLYVESKKIIQVNPFIKQKLTHRHRKQIYRYPRGKMERDKFVIWD